MLLCVHFALWHCAVSQNLVLDALQLSSVILQEHLQQQLAAKTAQVQFLQSENANLASEVCQLKQRVCSLWQETQSMQEPQHQVPAEMIPMFVIFKSGLVCTECSNLSYAEHQPACSKCTFQDTVCRICFSACCDGGRSDLVEQVTHIGAAAC